LEELSPVPEGLRARAATNRDGERVRALVFGVLAEFGLPPDPSTTDADLNDIEASYLTRGGVFELFEDAGGNLIGTVGLYPLEAETCELRKMYLLPEARGRGLGRYVLERAVGHARRLGFKRVVLETASVLDAARRLYTRFGFQPMPHEHTTPRADLSYYLDLTE
jgi:putative acetyltransferase